jgi:hypothetical protein
VGSQHVTIRSTQEGCWSLKSPNFFPRKGGRHGRHHLEGWGDGEVVRAYSGEEAGNNPYTEEAGQPSTHALCWANIAAWGGYSSMPLKGQQGGVATAQPC